ncbi:Dynein heavy chain cytoplasmic [Bienertia sinuspersici]
MMELINLVVGILKPAEVGIEEISCRLQTQFVPIFSSDEELSQVADTELLQYLSTFKVLVEEI